MDFVYSPNLGTVIPLQVVQGALQITLLASFNLCHFEKNLVIKLSAGTWAAFNTSIIQLELYRWNFSQKEISDRYLNPGFLGLHDFMNAIWSLP